MSTACTVPNYRGCSDVKRSAFIVDNSWAGRRASARLTTGIAVCSTARRMHAAAPRRLPDPNHKDGSAFSRLHHQFARQQIEDAAALLLATNPTGSELVRLALKRRLA